MQKSNKSYGSSFYYLQPNDIELKTLQNHKTELNNLFNFFYSGRNAFLAVFNDVNKNIEVNTIWLPSYYCDTVVDLLIRNFKNVEYYNVDPFHFENEIDITKFAKKNDVVILNNFWGLSAFKKINESSNQPIIIEDHSHGWLSEQSLNSKANYCICSLRKTYPIALGAVAWKPNSNKCLEYNNNTHDLYITEAYDMLANSMQLKRKFIKNLNTKKNYLDLLGNGESLLNLSNNYIKPNDELINQIQAYFEYNPNQIKLENFKLAKATIKESDKFKIVDREGFTPFGLLLLFKNKENFKSFKIWMISNNIYPAHLWPNTKNDSEWKYLFNLHIDFRYNKEDISYLIEKINFWIENNV